MIESVFSAPASAWVVEVSQQEATEIGDDCGLWSHHTEFEYGSRLISAFLLSHHLHKITESHQRATVLSFRGLSYNPAYGTLALLYAALIDGLEKNDTLKSMALTKAETADWTFAQALLWLPGYFLLLALLLNIIRGYYLQKNGRRHITAKPKTSGTL